MSCFQYRIGYGSDDGFKSTVFKTNLPLIMTRETKKMLQEKIEKKDNTKNVLIIGWIRK
jgi:hypothetical protein